MPMGTATIIAERLADALSATYGVLLAPTVEFGVNAETERDFAGNATMRKKTLHRMLNDLLGSWEETGFKEFILITAHDHDPHQEALSTVTTKRARVRVVDVFAIQLADLLDGQPAPMHGGEAETSLMLYLAPDLVHLDRAHDHPVSIDVVRRRRLGGVRLPKDGAGTFGRPSLATAEKGQLIFERIRTRISERIFLAPPPPE